MSSKESSKELFCFPKWTNQLVLGILAAGTLVPAYLGLLMAFAADPVTLNVGYAPVQPVPYSHALHVGKLGMDCRYCHNSVEKASFAALPPAQTCMNCHATIFNKSPKLLPVRESFATGKPVPWIKVHDLPDYVFFNHSAHVNSGVSCLECHGKINHMEVVAQVKPMNMAWCLSCHRDPDPRLRPKSQVTNLDWVAPEDPRVLGARLRKDYHVNPNSDCVTCHR